MSVREIEFANHRIINPLTDEQLMLLGRVAQVVAGTKMLDFACGKGEMLCRCAKEYGAVGEGLDINPTFVTAARQRAADLMSPARSTSLQTTLALTPGPDPTTSSPASVRSTSLAAAYPAGSPSPTTSTS